MQETVQWSNKIHNGHNYYLVFDYTYNYQHIYQLEQILAA